jgi:gliding motility-associated-like protein
MLRLLLPCFFFIFLASDLRAQVRDTILCDTSVYVPGKFEIHPGDRDNYFKLRFRGTQPETYQLKIYGPAGKLVFSAVSPEIGWDGTNYGEALPDGNFIWYLYYLRPGETRMHACVGVVECRGLVHAIPRLVSDSLPCDSLLFIPVIFQPNCEKGDCKFQPVLRCPPLDYEFVIYDRYGNIIFATYDPQQGWNGSDTAGREVKEGTYFWTISCQYSTTGEPKLHSGVLTLVW